jgi:hypothetical protein
MTSTQPPPPSTNSGLSEVADDSKMASVPKAITTPPASTKKMPATTTQPDPASDYDIHTTPVHQTVMTSTKPPLPSTTSALKRKLEIEQEEEKQEPKKQKHAPVCQTAMTSTQPSPPSTNSGLSEVADDSKMASVPKAITTPPASTKKMPATTTQKPTASSDEHESSESARFQSLAAALSKRPFDEVEEIFFFHAPEPDSNGMYFYPDEPAAKQPPMGASKQPGMGASIDDLDQKKAASTASSDELAKQPGMGASINDLDLQIFYAMTAYAYELDQMKTTEQVKTVNLRVNDVCCDMLRKHHKNKEMLDKLKEMADELVNQPIPTTKIDPPPQLLQVIESLCITATNWLRATTKTPPQVPFKFMHSMGEGVKRLPYLAQVPDGSALLARHRLIASKALEQGILLRILDENGHPTKTQPLFTTRGQPGVPGEFMQPSATSMPMSRQQHKQMQLGQDHKALIARFYKNRNRTVELHGRTQAAITNECKEKLVWKDPESGETHVVEEGDPHFEETFEKRLDQLVIDFFEPYDLLHRNPLVMGLSGGSSQDLGANPKSLLYATTDEGHYVIGSPQSASKSTNPQLLRAWEQAGLITVFLYIRTYYDESRKKNESRKKKASENRPKWMEDKPDVLNLGHMFIDSYCGFNGTEVVDIRENLISEVFQNKKNGVNLCYKKHRNETTFYLHGPVQVKLKPGLPLATDLRLRLNHFHRKKSQYKFVNVSTKDLRNVCLEQSIVQKERMSQLLGNEVLDKVPINEESPEGSPGNLLMLENAKAGFSFKFETSNPEEGQQVTRQNIHMFSRLEQNRILGRPPLPPDLRKEVKQMCEDVLSIGRGEAVALSKDAYHLIDRSLISRNLAVHCIGLREDLVSGVLQWNKSAEEKVQKRIVRLSPQMCIGVILMVYAACALRAGDPRRTTMLTTQLERMKTQLEDNTEDHPGGTEDANNSMLSPAPATAQPVTASPVSAAPVSAAPVSAAPVSAAPVTSTPVTSPPVSAAPVSAAPVTSPPVTSATITGPPVTSSPVSSPPVTSPPVSAAPVTAQPVSSAPVTGLPVTSPPVTSSPVTSPPITAPPVTAPPITIAPGVEPSGEKLDLGNGQGEQCFATPLHMPGSELITSPAIRTKALPGGRHMDVATNFMRQQAQILIDYFKKNGIDGEGKVIPDLHEEQLFTHEHPLFDGQEMKFGNIFSAPNLKRDKNTHAVSSILFMANIFRHLGNSNLLERFPEWKKKQRPLYPEEEKLRLEHEYGPEDLCLPIPTKKSIREFGLFLSELTGGYEVSIAPVISKQHEGMINKETVKNAKEVVVYALCIHFDHLPGGYIFRTIKKMGDVTVANQWNRTKIMTAVV